MKKFVCLLIAAITLITLASCNKKDTAKKPNNETRTEPLTVALYTEFYNGYEQKWFDRVNLLLEENGVSIKFVNQGGIKTQKDLDSINQFLAEGAAVIIDAQNDRYIDDGLLQELTQYEQYAPNYFKDLPIWNAAKIPIFSFDHESLGNYAVMVRNELLDEYNRPITTASEYDQFLQWVENNKPNYVPLTTLITKPNYGLTNFYSLLLPEMGYLPIDTYFYDGISLCVDIDSGEIIPVEKLPELDELIEKALYWNKYKIFRTESDSYSDIESADTVASFFGQMSMLYNGYSKIIVNKPEIVFHVEDFQLCVLYPDKIPQNKSTRYRLRICGGKEADLSGLFSFIEKMNTDIDFYKNIQFGIEGDDYELVNGEIITLENDIHDEFFGDYLQTFRNYTFDETLKPENAPPKQYQEAASEITYPNISDIEKLNKYSSYFLNNVITQLDTTDFAYGLNRRNILNTILNKIRLQTPVSDIALLYEQMLSADSLIQAINSYE